PDTPLPRQEIPLRLGSRECDRTPPAASDSLFPSQVAVDKGTLPDSLGIFEAAACRHPHIPPEPKERRTMATFQLRRCSPVGVLRAIAPHQLVTFLEPYRTFLAAQGAPLPAPGAPGAPGAP